MKQDQGSVETLKYQDGSDDVHFAHFLNFILDYFKPDTENTEFMLLAAGIQLFSMIEHSQWVDLESIFLIPIAHARS